MKRAGILFLIFVIILTFTVKLLSMMGPVDPLNNQQTFINIKPGSSSRNIGELLFENKLITSKKLFNLVVALTGYDDQLQAGYYAFKKSDNLWEVVRKLSAGKVATFKITIPEGFTVEEIAERLGKLTPYSKEEFMNEIKNWSKENSILPSRDVKYSLEGFLYPDTYIIPREFTPAQMLGVFMEHFQTNLWEKLKEEAVKTRYSPLEILTIASLIEKEAKLDQEMPTISAVIHNRLETRMLLQIDAAVQYSFAERKERLYYKDLRVDSPYNTYKYYGLPPGPICNPGEEAIEAALNPADVDYLFYFALDDGSHVFTTSYQDHLREQLKINR